MEKVPLTNDSAPISHPLNAAESPLRGYLMVASAAVLWASSGIAAKVLFNAGMSPLVLSRMRATISGLMLLALLLISRPATLRVKGRDIPNLLFMGLILAATHFTYLSTISRLPVAAAILLQYQAPVIIVIWYVLTGRRPGIAMTVSLVAAVAGCYLMVGGYNFDLFAMNMTGIAFGLASAACFAAYSLRSEQAMRSYPSQTVLLYALIGAALVWNIADVSWQEWARLESGQWWKVLYICVFGTVAAFGLYTEGMRRIGASTAGITAILEPVSAGVLAVVLLGEVLAPIQIVGAVIVIGAVLLLRLGEGRLKSDVEGS